MAYLQECSEFLVERKTETYSVCLHWCGHFFAEVWCHDSGEVDYVRAFRSADILEPYLEDISIDSLFQLH